MGLEAVALDDDAQTSVREVDPADPLPAVPDAHLRLEAGDPRLEQDRPAARLERVRRSSVQHRQPGPRHECAAPAQRAHRRRQLLEVHHPLPQRRVADGQRHPQRLVAQAVEHRPQGCRDVPVDVAVGQVAVPEPDLGRHVVAMGVGGDGQADRALPRGTARPQCSAAVACERTPRSRSAVTRSPSVAGRW